MRASLFADYTKLYPSVQRAVGCYQLPHSRLRRGDILSYHNQTLP